MNNSYLIYILVMAGVTYLIRMIPLAAVKGKIRSRFVQSFIYYVPYAVLSAMTIPAIFTAAPSLLASLAGLFVGIAAALVSDKLLTVALSACGAVLAVELLMMLLGA